MSVLAHYQHASALQMGATERFALSGYSPSDTPFSGVSKARDKARVAALARELDGLQNLFYADRRYRLLVVLQGTDTSGKDGTIRGVFGQMSPLGVRTVAWKVPSEPEREHDFLWRIHRQVPGNGEVTIFNRSHYEDVLVPVVSRTITAEQTRLRYAQINDFERLLAQSGTVICKFLLHISKEEQRTRLQKRLDDRAKNWKFEPADLAARAQWSAFQKAYSDAVAATGTPWAPWTIVPADSKTHRDLMIATVVREVLMGLKLRFPPMAPALKKLKVV